jgi:hypothetical protein
MIRSLIQINVGCYSGYRADEYPVCFYLGEVRLEIKEIIDRWYQGDANPDFPVADYFKVRASDGVEYVLKHEIKTDMWFMYR